MPRVVYDYLALAAALGLVIGPMVFVAIAAWQVCVSAALCIAA